MNPPYEALDGSFQLTSSNKPSLLISMTKQQDQIDQNVTKYNRFSSVVH